MTAWVIRSGQYGERAEWAWEKGYSGAGWQAMGPELLSCKTREEVQSYAAEKYAHKPQALPNITAQLWMLLGRITIGDLIVMPIKQTREIALGWASTPLQYLHNEEDPSKRLVIGVNWVNRVPRTAVKQDLLYSLGATLTVFSPSRNQAEDRLKALLETGTDPGMRQESLEKAAAALSSVAAGDTGNDPDAPAIQQDIEEMALDQISELISQEFTGHGLTRLIADILRAEGFNVEESPEGPDGGIDIIAGRGLLGLESPKILVQVKTPKVDRPVVQQLTGLVSSHEADYGLIVAWGGLTSDARREVMGKRFRLKVWDDQDIIHAVLSNYEKLSSTTTQALPLKQIWVPGETADTALE